MNIEHQKEEEKIDIIIKQFFNLFNTKSKTVLHLEAIRDLCIPETILIKISGTGQVVYTLDSFISPRKAILSDGTLKDFEEFELSNKTVISKNMACRYCRYQKKGALNGKTFSACGTKMFLLIKTHADWKITSLTWEDDENQI